MSQHRCTGPWTDEAMDDADAIYTTTTMPHMLMVWRHPLHQQLLPRPSCCDIDLVQLQSFSKHRHPTTTTSMPFETDEAERHGRALLVLYLRYTGSWTPTRLWMTPTPTSTPPPPSCIENAKRRPKMTTTRQLNRRYASKLVLRR